MYPEEMIKKELKKRNLNDLYYNFVSLRSFESVMAILNLPEWKEKDEKAHINNSNVEQVQRDINTLG